MCSARHSKRDLNVYEFMMATKSRVSQCVAPGCKGMGCVFCCGCFFFVFLLMFF